MPDEPEDAELAELAQQLREAAGRLDPVPFWVVQAARDSLAWSTIDADLAELVFDSLVDQDEQALIGASADQRLLSFEARGLTIDVRIDHTGVSRRLVGQLVPAQRAAVELRQPAGVAAVDTDDLGRFSCGLVPAGPISLRCNLGTGPGRRPVVTDWVSI